MFHVWKDDNRCLQDFTLCKRQLEGLRYGWKDNACAYFKQMGCSDCDWIHLV
jgi:hypothetical protein